MNLSDVAPSTSTVTTLQARRPRVSRPAIADTTPAGLSNRFLAAGVEALDDTELLQLLLSPFHPPHAARELALTLLDRFDTPARVAAAPIGRLFTVPGLCDSSIAAIKAAEAIGIRLAHAAVPNTVRQSLDSYDRVVAYCRALAGHRSVEEFRILFLDVRNRLIRDELHQRGTLSHTPAYPREIVIRALEVNAAALIVLHNHPSSDPSPSKTDISVTARIKEALKLIDVQLHDHIIVTQSHTFSFRSKGLL